MKKTIIFLILLIISFNLHARDLLLVAGINSEYQTESASIENISTHMDSQTFGAHGFFAVYQDDEQLGGGFSSNLFFRMLGNLSFGDRLLFGACLRPKADTFIASVLSGLILQPELELYEPKGSAFSFLVGFGMDIAFGSLKNFGTALTISTYPLAFITYNDGSSNSAKLDIKNYRRLSIGITIGTSTYASHVSRNPN